MTNQIKVLDQWHGDTCSLYQGDSCLVMKGIPDESIDFSIYSPPFETLYIYSDSVADMGNSADNEEFMQQFMFLMPELYRVMKPGSSVGVHCKDLPLYMNRDGAAGLSNFPGRLIKAHEMAGFTLDRWVTIWKDPVIEMQRTKNHGLLHKNFMERAECCRQGMADYLLIFRKPSADDWLETPRHPHRPWKHMSQVTLLRCLDLWTNRNESVLVSSRNIQSAKDAGYKIIASDSDGAIPFALIEIDPKTSTARMADEMPCVYRGIALGRNLVVRSRMHADGNRLIDTASEIISAAEAAGLTFQSRCVFPNGYYLLVFRKWSADVEAMPDKQVRHVPRPGVFIGTDKPTAWDSERDWTIQIWQKYASPVWYDVGEGTRSESPNVWYDIHQTRVLNVREGRDNSDEKHICPLQLDVINKAIGEYTNPGDVVFTPFAGLGSEVYEAVLMKRRGIGIELKGSYFSAAVKNCRHAELMKRQKTLF